jgi:hypothetical protein
LPDYGKEARRDKDLNLDNQINSHPPHRRSEFLAVVAGDVANVHCPSSLPPCDGFAGDELAQEVDNYKEAYSVFQPHIAQKLDTSNLPSLHF